MKRINIEYSTYYNFVDGLSIRPSVKKRIRQALSHKGFYDTTDLCKKSEDDLRAVEGIDGELVDKIKAQMLNAGLHFNMTDEQLDDYLDAEFLRKKHFDPNMSFKKWFWDKCGVKLLFFAFAVIPFCGLAYYWGCLLKSCGNDSPEPPKFECHSKSYENLTPSASALEEDSVIEEDSALEDEADEKCNENGIPYSELDKQEERKLQNFRPHQ